MAVTLGSGGAGGRGKRKADNNNDPPIDTTAAYSQGYNIGVSGKSERNIGNYTREEEVAAFNEGKKKGSDVQTSQFSGGTQSPTAPPKQPINPVAHIKFNADNTVDYTTDPANPNSKPLRLSKEEYNAVLRNESPNAQGKALQTPQVSNILENQQTVRDKNAIAQQQNKTQALAQPPKQLPTIQPQPLGPDAPPINTDLLDLGKIGGGALAGATTVGGIGAGIGSIVPGVGTLAGGIAGGILGGIGGAATSFFYNSADDRKQAVKTGYNKFQGSTENMQKIINSVNAGKMSTISARLAWDSEYARVLQSEREIKQASRGWFGEKLAHSQDELTKIETWKRRYAQFNQDFEASLLQPNPNNINTEVGVPAEVIQ